MLLCERGHRQYWTGFARFEAYAIHGAFHVAWGIFLWPRCGQTLLQKPFLNLVLFDLNQPQLAPIGFPALA